MQERFVKNPGARPNRLQKVGEALSSGGISILMQREIPVQEVQEIESQGFDFEAIQAFIDTLDRSTSLADHKNAAMLRGAFNDLLGRIPDETEDLKPPAIPEAG